MRGGRVDVDLDLDPCRPQALAELAEVVELAQPRRRPHRGRLVVLGRAQGPQRGAQVVEGLAAELLDVLQRPAGLLRVAVEQVRADPGLDVDRDHRVRDDVVDVAGDPQPLLADPAQRLLLAGALGGLGPLDQRVVGGAALADGRAEQQGRGDEGEVLRQLGGR